LRFLKRFSLILYKIIYPDEEMNSYIFSCIIPFDIVLQFICSYFLLKVHFYKLQYFSLFLNIGTFIIILIFDLINVLYRKLFDGKIYFFYLVHTISFSVEFSLAKKLFLYGFISVYSLMFIKGFIELFLVLLFSMIMFFAKRDIFPKMMFFLNDKKCLWLLIAKVFSIFFINLFRWLIIDRFSPNYYPFALISEEFCYFIFYIITKTIDLKIISWDLYIRMFLYLISINGVFIHNEIVVINICNLGSDTKYFLDLKFQGEELYSKTDNPEILKRYETFIEMECENGNSKENEDDDLSEKRETIYNIN